ncbi:uncharacterized protein LOC129764866 [Toxorhynchites rutilus septentrionalis]|uniref:uncharacterized protein LOC129764866 n=1 Tax=Toxorhynchites rutilus septentrionalis TaxID=329112 RepID=UPI002479F708|nr:uncharacterized protein LOC129764866 [Toxorhynchites rutilus septentrionalis]
MKISTIKISALNVARNPAERRELIDEGTSDPVKSAHTEMCTATGEREPTHELCADALPNNKCDDFHVSYIRERDPNVRVLRCNCGSSQRCQKCEGEHHTLLHFDSSPNSHPTIPIPNPFRIDVFPVFPISPLAVTSCSVSDASRNGRTVLIIDQPTKLNENHALSQLFMPEQNFPEWKPTLVFAKIRDILSTYVAKKDDQMRNILKDSYLPREVTWKRIILYVSITDTGQLKKVYPLSAAIVVE